MSAATTEPTALPHTIFLRRLADESAASSVTARLTQGAFMALRLVDLIEFGQPVYGDAFRYQHAATERLCRDLPPDRTETAHLVGLVRSAADAFQAQDVHLVLPALLAYAHHLEDEMLLDEARDVLDTATRVAGERLATADVIAVRLRTARVLRKLNAFDDATRLYAEAGALAASVGDQRSALLSRLGQGYTLLGRGNLAEAETRLRETLRAAEESGDRHGLALAHQGLGVVLSTGGRTAEAIPHTWRAFELYEDDPSRTRVLADLGVMLLTIGDADGAECALAAVVRARGVQEAVQNALIELMHCASYRRDRVGFERWRERCEAVKTDMPRNILADFYLKMGIGRARFGQFDKAESLLATALQIAEGAGLHEVVFRIERINAGLRDCPQGLTVSPEAAAEPVSQSDAIRDVSASLARLDA